MHVAPVLTAELSSASSRLVRRGQMSRWRLFTEIRPAAAAYASVTMLTLCTSVSFVCKQIGDTSPRILIFYSMQGEGSKIVEVFWLRKYHMAENPNFDKKIGHIKNFIFTGDWSIAVTCYLRQPQQ